MPTFDTPQPIFATVDVGVGDVRIIASDRTDTVVEVRPRDPAKDSHVKVAEQTRIEYANGQLLVKGPKPGLFAIRSGAIDVLVELPTGSKLRGDSALGDFSCDGELGECRIKSAAGSIEVGHAGPLTVNTSSGKVTVDRAVGHTEVTGAGVLRIREIDGTAVIKNLNGDIWVGEATSDLRLNSANGNISVDRALATVGAKTANGNVRIGEVVRGSVVMETAYGELEIGIRAGTAALLDVRSSAGKVRNSLDAATGPAPTDETVKVRARTASGDILIHRS
jgi:DUF4097 and DUF4098 domain-containing protein YvlB